MRLGSNWHCTGRVKRYPSVLKDYRSVAVQLLMVETWSWLGPFVGRVIELSQARGYLPITDMGLGQFRRPNDCLAASTGLHLAVKAGFVQNMRQRECGRY